MSCNKEVLEDLRTLNEKFVRLEFNLTITRNADNFLSSQLAEMERQCWADSQQSKREALEVVGLLKSLSINQMEGKVCNIFRKLGYNITKDDLDVYHCFKLKKERLLSFVNRRIASKFSGPKMT